MASATSVACSRDAEQWVSAERVTAVSMPTHGCAAIRALASIQAAFRRSAATATNAIFVERRQHVKTQRPCGGRLPPAVGEASSPDRRLGLRPDLLNSKTGWKPAGRIRGSGRRPNLRRCSAEQTRRLRTPRGGFRSVGKGRGSATRPSLGGMASVARGHDSQGSGQRLHLKGSRRLFDFRWESTSRWAALEIALSYRSVLPSAAGGSCGETL